MLAILPPGRRHFDSDSDRLSLRFGIEPRHNAEGDTVLVVTAAVPIRAGTAE